MSLFVAGLILTWWAGSGTAAAAAAVAKVVVPVNGRDVLELSCADDQLAGFKDGFCRVDGPSLLLNFDRGLAGLNFGVQPASRYVFGDVMYVTNISGATVDVTVTVDEAAGGSLYQVMSVDLTDPDGNRHDIFSPVLGGGTSKSVALDPGEAVVLSFGVAVPANWAALHGEFASADTRFELTGAVIVQVGFDDEQSGVQPTEPTPNPDDDDEPEDGTPGDDDQSPGDNDDGETDREIPPPEPGGGPTPTEPGSGGTHPSPPWSGPLPFTGGSHWPFVIAGLLLMAAGAWLYVRSQPRTVR